MATRISVRGPDADDLVWLQIDRWPRGKSMLINLGYPGDDAADLALRLSGDRETLFRAFREKIDEEQADRRVALTA